MAPEQILGLPLDGRADLYALGCCAWWLLTGRELFDREGPDARILHKHMVEPAPSLAACMTGWCPPALEAVIAACLAKDVAGRPGDARALAQMLRAIDIPADVDWSTEHAAAWWRAYQPAIPSTSVSSSEVQVIMPAGTAQRPGAATSETAIAQTIASPPPATTRD
jgi:serine/threonine-protein kinase